MKKFLKIAGIILLQILIGIAIFLVAIRVASNAEMHYAGRTNFIELMEKADTPAEFQKGGVK